jgi:hypothetical protein
MDALPSVEFQAAHRLLRTPLAIPGLKKVVMVRGTEAHVGKLGSQEEIMARVLEAGDEDLPPVPILRDPSPPENRSAYRFRLEVEGKLIDCSHHGRFGQRSHTRDSYLRLYAHDIWESCVRSGDRAPDLAIRSHHHQYGDSGFIHDLPTRVVATPAWQYPTAFIHRIGSETLPSVGLVAFDIRESRIDVHPILFKPERPQVVNL